MIAPSPCHDLAAVLRGIVFCSPVTTWEREDQGFPANKRMRLAMTGMSAMQLDARRRQIEKFSSGFNPESLHERMVPGRPAANPMVG
jgi:hypothetical protein